MAKSQEVRTYFHLVDLPAGIDAVMAQALAKEPTERFASGGDMAFALRECASSVFARASNE